MLVLTRHVGEKLVIGHTVEISIVDVRRAGRGSTSGDKVRIGIQAPKNIPVHRLEVYEAVYGEFGNNNCTPPHNPARSDIAEANDELLKVGAEQRAAESGEANVEP